MQLVVPNKPNLKEILKKAQLIGILENICQQLELTNTQFETAKNHYEAVTEWLAKSDIPSLLNTVIYPQGSISLGTTVKPLNQEEYDIDLVCHVPKLAPSTLPKVLKKIIGNRLRENAHYQNIIEEKPRCWRLNYANAFHLDITPSILNPACVQGGELVPDKRLEGWKETNPKGYREWFNARSNLQPKLNILKAEFAEARANIESLPEPTRFKGLLRRCVQLAKRHRDISFNNEQSNSAPISIIITTLIAKSYEYCATYFTYDTELDFFLDVLRKMPSFINVEAIDGQPFYFVWNETTQGENFAEKWNEDKQLAWVFYRWHKQIIAAIEDMINFMSKLNSGLDQIGKQLSHSFGESAVSGAIRRLIDTVSNARHNRVLTIAPKIGLSTGVGQKTSVRPNTFFGS